MQYCSNCVMPDTRPDLKLNEQGVCSACQSYANRQAVDWSARLLELEPILDKYRSKDHSRWDCIIPVSGGKDSTYQVLRMLQLGMNPLCITATTGDLSDIGGKNIENIKNLGVDYVEFSANPVVRRKMNRIGLLNVGDISWPEHCGIFTIPVRAAVQFGVPLIVWGENPQNEYGGPVANASDNVLTPRWLERFGGLLGITPIDLIWQEGIQQRDSIPYL